MAVVTDIDAGLQKHYERLYKKVHGVNDPATLDEISEGRAILGLGTSGKNVIEHLHGVKFEKPLTRMRETIDILHAFWAGERLEPRDEARDHLVSSA